MTETSSPDPVVVVGGGVSGLASAVGLTARGIPTILLEQKPTLGGRAYSFTDATTGDTVDNGQHVLIAGYEHTRALLQTVGAIDLLSIQKYPALLFHHPTHGFDSLRLPPLPSPLHLAWGLLGFRLLSRADRWKLLGAGLSIYRTGQVKNRVPAEWTIAQWLDDLGQSPESQRSFWEPMAIAIMNEHIAQASAQVFVHTLRSAFLSGWHSAALAIPRVGLSALYVEPSRQFIAGHGGTIRCGTDVVGLETSGLSVRGVRLRTDSAVPCSAAILAVPPNRLGELLPGVLREDPAFAALESISPSPIISIYLWFDQDFMEDEFVGLIGRSIQWVFNRRKIARIKGNGGHLVAVISAAYDVVSYSNEELTRLAVDDLCSAYPGCPTTPRHALVIREKRATFPSTPRSEPFRPSQRTPLHNLFLAGDWTSTGFPATIEGAVVSAERCVELAVDCISTQKSRY